MQLKVVINNDKGNDILAHALLLAGQWLNGARKIISGKYIAPNPGDFDLHVDTFTLGDKWFNGNDQTISTVQNALINAVGIELTIDANEDAVGFTIVNQTQYDKTITAMIHLREQKTNQHTNNRPTQIPTLIAEREKSGLIQSANKPNEGISSSCPSGDDATVTFAL